MLVRASGGLNDRLRNVRALSIVQWLANDVTRSLRHRMKVKKLDLSVGLKFLNPRQIFVPVSALTIIGAGLRKSTGQNAKMSRHNPSIR
jgi:hypothetical protein